MSSKPKPGVLARKAYAGFFWQLMGATLTTVLSVLHIIVMARLLNPEIFGQFAIASIIISLTMIVSEFGLGPALVQKSSITDEDITFVFLSNFALGLTLFALLFIFSDSISAAFSGAISPLMIKILALNVLVRPLGLASKSVLLRNMDFRKIFIATNLSYFIGMLIVGVTLAVLGYGIWSLIIGLIVTSAVASCYFLIVSRIPWSSRFSQNSVVYLCRYGLGLTSVQGVNQFSLMADKLILSQVAATSFLGLYERSQRIQQMPGVFIGGVLDTVLFSALSKFSDNKTLLGKHFFNFVTLGILVGVYLSTLLFTFADLVVVIVLGQDWLEATEIMQLISVLIAFQLVSRLTDTYIRATGAFKKSIKVKLCYLLLVFGLTFVGYQLNSITGAVVGIIFASILHTLMMIIVCQRDSGYSFQKLWNNFRPGLILAVFLLVKNIAILEIMAASLPLLTFIVVLLTDALVVFLLLSSAALIGTENKDFIFTQLKGLLDTLKSRLQ